MKILLIETHSDDGWLSNSRLFTENNKIDLVTLFRWDRSSELLKTFPNVKCDFLGKGDDDGNEGSNINFYYEVNNFYEAQRDENKAKNIYSSIQSHYPVMYRDIDSRLKEVLRKYDLNSYDLVLAPIGIFHREHIIVSKILDDLKDKRIKRYADIPYLNSFSALSHFNERVKYYKDEFGFNPEVFIIDTDKKHEMFHKLYPTEGRTGRHLNFPFEIIFK